MMKDKAFDDAVEALNWSIPIEIEELRIQRELIPRVSGVYVFSEHQQTLQRNLGTLYIGKAKSLRKRLSSYLSSPFEVRLLSSKKKDKALSRSLRHTGKNLLLMEIQQRSRYGRSGVWVRWLCHEKPSEIENLLIAHYQPSFNTVANPRVSR